MKIFADYEQIMRETEQGSVYALASVESAAPFLTVERKANAACADVIDFKGNIQIFIKQLAHYLQSDYKIVLTYENETQKQSLLSLMESYRLSTSEQIGVGNHHAAEISPVRGHGLRFGQSTARSVCGRCGKGNQTPHRKKTKSERSTFFADIKPATMSCMKHTASALRRHPSNACCGHRKGLHQNHLCREDVLYVPADQMDLVQKYIGTSDTPPRLNRLGSADWSNTKAKSFGCGQRTCAGIPEHVCGTEKPHRICIWAGHGMAKRI
jgi:transcription-repair coupling factor (superfamily II helicase)